MVHSTSFGAAAGQTVSDCIFALQLVDPDTHNSILLYPTTEAAGMNTFCTGCLHSEPKNLIFKTRLSFFLAL